MNSIVVSVNGPVILEENSNSTLDVKSGERVANVASEVISPDKITLYIGDPSESRLPQTDRSWDSRVVCLAITPDDGKANIERRSEASLASPAPSDENLSIGSSSQLPLGSVVEVINPISNCVRTIGSSSKKYNESLYQYFPSPLSVPDLDSANEVQDMELCPYSSPTKEQECLERLKTLELRKGKGETLSYDAICMLEQDLLKCQKDEYNEVRFKYVEGLEKVTRFSKWERIFTRVKMLKISFTPPKRELSTPITTPTSTTTTTHHCSIAICCSALALIVIAGVGLLIDQYR